MDIGEAVVEALEDRVDLGAQARGDDHRLGEMRAVPEHGERLGELLVGDREPLEQLERCVTLVETDHHHRHDGDLLLSGLRAEPPA